MDRSALHRPSSVGAGSRLDSPQTTRGPAPSDMLPPEPVQALRRSGVERRSPKSFPSPTSLNTDGNSSALVQSDGSGGSTPQRVAPVAPMVRTAAPETPSSTEPASEIIVADRMKEVMLATTDATSAKIERDRAKMLVDQADIEIQNSAKWFLNFASIKEQKENNKTKAEKVFKERDKEYEKARAAQDVATAAMALAVTTSAGTAAPANDEVQAELRALRDQIQRRDAEYKALQTEIAKILDTVSPLMRSTVSHTEQLTLLQKEQRRIASDYSLLQRNLDAVKNDQGNIWRKQDDEAARVRALENHLDEDHDQLKVLKKGLNEDLASLTKENKALKNNNNEWRSGIKAVETGIHAIKADVYNLKTKELKEQLDTVKKVKEDIEKAKSDIETSIATIKTEHASLEQKVDGQGVKLEELEKGVYTGEERKFILDQVALLEKVVEKNEKAVEQLKDRSNEEKDHIIGRLDLLENERRVVEHLQEDLGQVGKRLELMESRAQIMAIAPVSNSASSGAGGEQLKAQIEGLTMEVRTVKSDIAGLLSDQTTFEKDILPHWDQDVTNIKSKVDANKTEMLQRIGSIEDKISEHGKQIASLYSRPQPLPVNQATASPNQQRTQPPVSPYGPVSPGFVIPSQNVQNVVSSPPPQIHDLSHQLQAQLGPLRIELHSLQGRMSNLDVRSQASYADLVQRQNTCIQAIQSLENRYDNLTTEELTRNMVNQMQTLYPHASNFQAEIERMRRQYSAIDARLLDLESKYNSVPEIANQVSQINSKADALISTVKSLSDSRERWDDGAGKALEVKIELEKFQDSINSNAAAKLSAEAAAKAANDESIRSVIDTTQRLVNEVNDLNKETKKLVDRVNGQQNAVSVLQAVVEKVNNGLSSPINLPDWDMKVD